MEAHFSGTLPGCMAAGWLLSIERSPDHPSTRGPRQSARQQAESPGKGRWSYSTRLYYNVASGLPRRSVERGTWNAAGARMHVASEGGPGGAMQHGAFSAVV